MSKANKKNSMGFTERLQSEASDIAIAAVFIVESGLAEWRIVEMPDGKKWIALLFKPTVWAIQDGRLTLKTGK